MKYGRKYLYCQHCGNMVKKDPKTDVTISAVCPISPVIAASPKLLHKTKAAPSCCGEPMRQLVPNTADAAIEKHVPVAARMGTQLKVAVGSQAHPMTVEHSILWVSAVQGGAVQRAVLAPSDRPEVEFQIQGSKPVSVYAYCNLHGLWAADA